MTNEQIEKNIEKLKRQICCLSANGESLFLSAIGSTPNADGATLTGSTLNLEPASASFGGVWTTGVQTLPGNKTFTGTDIFSNDLTIHTVKAGLGAGSVATNTAFGFETINTAGGTGYNTAIGYQANKAGGNFLTTAVGGRALILGGGDYDTAFGVNTLQAATAGSTRNTAVGYGASFSLTNGTNNTTLGWGSGFSILGGDYNIGVGVAALGSGSGGGGVATMSGNYNIAIGHNAGYNFTTAEQNIVIGENAGTQLVTGSYNVILGGNTGLSINGLSNHMIFADGQGNERFRVDDNGFMGINNTSPSVALDVVGTANISAGINTGQLNIDDGTQRLFIYNDGENEIESVDASNINIIGAPVRIGDLSGTGSRVVEADANGTLSATQIISSGTYTPTLTNTTNIAASTAYECQYLRIGNTVTVSGQVDIDVTTGATATELRMTLPIATSFSGDNQAGGTASCRDFAGDVISIQARSGQAYVQFKYISNADATNHAYFFSFTYQIV